MQLFSRLGLIALTIVNAPIHAAIAASPPVPELQSGSETINQSIQLSPASRARSSGVTVRLRATGLALSLTVIKGIKTTPSHILYQHGYNPFLTLVPRWKNDCSPVVLLSFQQGAEDHFLDVFGFVAGKLQKLQEFEANGIDVIQYSAEDGNGDVRLFDGLPLAFRCFSWSANASRFIQHACRSLPSAAPSPTAADH